MVSWPCPPKIASERLGHSTIGIALDLYGHVRPGIQADAAEQVDAAIRRAVKAPEQAFRSKMVANAHYRTLRNWHKYL
jgi:hypothetical protein